MGPLRGRPSRGPLVIVVAVRAGNDAGCRVTRLETLDGCVLLYYPPLCFGNLVCQSTLSLLSGDFLSG